MSIPANALHPFLLVPKASEPVLVLLLVRSEPTWALDTVRVLRTPDEGRLSGKYEALSLNPCQDGDPPGTADKLERLFLTVTLPQALEHQQSIHCLLRFMRIPSTKRNIAQSPPVTECRMRFDQRVECVPPGTPSSRGGAAAITGPRPQPEHGKISRTLHALRIDTPEQRRHHSSDVPGVTVGNALAASRRMFQVRMVSSPTLPASLSRLTSSSRNASSSLLPSTASAVHHAPSRKRSRHASTSATFSPCRRAASTAVVSPLSKLIIKAARRLAVQRWTSSGRSSSAICHLAGPSTLYYWWLDLKGEHDSVCDQNARIGTGHCSERTQSRWFYRKRQRRSCRENCLSCAEPRNPSLSVISRTYLFRVLGAMPASKAASVPR